MAVSPKGRVLPPGLVPSAFLSQPCADRPSEVHTILNTWLDVRDNRIDQCVKCIYTDLVPIVYASALPLHTEGGRRTISTTASTSTTSALMNARLLSLVSSYIWWANYHLVYTERGGHLPSGTP